MVQGNSMRIQSLELHSMSLKVHVEEMEEKYKNITACHQAQIWTTQNVKKRCDYYYLYLKQNVNPFDLSFKTSLTGKGMIDKTEAI